jgi:hypothetical protein
VTGDAGPFVADWNGDGIPDLFLGADDGSVTVYRGSGKEGTPNLSEEEVLVPPLPEDMSHATEIRCELDPSTGHVRMPELDRPWIRTKPAVADWNGDGKPDLLVGDLVHLRGPEPRLTDAQKREKDELDGKSKKVSAEISKLSSKARAEARKELGSRDTSSDDVDSADQVEERTSEILSKDPRYRELYVQGEEIWSKLKPYQAEFSAHGYVWVYLRTDAGTAAERKRGTSSPVTTNEATLRFDVTSKETGKPMRSVMVTLLPKKPQEEFSGWTHSKKSKGTIHEALRPDVDGNVEFTVPIDTAFAVRAMDMSDFRQRANQEVSALSARERRELRLAIPTEDDLALFGRVVSAADGSPIEGARIQVLSARRSFGGTDDERHERWSIDDLGQTRSDAQGSFHVGMKTWKSPHLRIEADGYACKIVAPTPGHETTESAATVKLLAEAKVRAHVPRCVWGPASWRRRGRYCPRLRAPPLRG